MRVKSAQDEYRALWERDARRLQAAGIDIAKDEALGRDNTESVRRFYTIAADGMTIADLLGRRRTVLEAKAVRDKTPDELRERQVYQRIDEEAAVLAVVPFQEAVDDIVRRTPALAANAAEVATIYHEGAGFAVARSAELHITARVQKEFARSITEGISTEAAIQAVGDWTRAYAEVVYRTNLNTAYTAGRFQQMFDPDISEVMGALEYNAVGDVDTRQGRQQDNGENHLAADGFLAAPTDTRWDRIAPPAGYNCRCSLRTVPKMELQERGLLSNRGTVTPVEPAGLENFSPHRNFAFSPVRRIYG